MACATAGVLECSFCRLTEKAEEIIQGPGITICHACTELAWEVVCEHRGLRLVYARATLANPTDGNGSEVT